MTSGSLWSVQPESRHLEAGTRTTEEVEGFQGLSSLVEVIFWTEVCKLSWVAARRSIGNSPGQSIVDLSVPCATQHLVNHDGPWMVRNTSKRLETCDVIDSSILILVSCAVVGICCPEHIFERLEEFTNLGETSSLVLSIAKVGRAVLQVM